MSGALVELCAPCENRDWRRRSFPVAEFVRIALAARGHRCIALCCNPIGLKPANPPSPEEDNTPLPAEHQAPSVQPVPAYNNDTGLEA
jgi:hypothetical protein